VKKALVVLAGFLVAGTLVAVAQLQEVPPPQPARVIDSAYRITCYLFADGEKQCAGWGIRQ
jgi:hypothetical protein